MSKQDIAVVIMAAGKGVRMKSALPKVMHEVCEKPMIGWVVELAKALKPKKIVVVEGHGKQHLREHLHDKGVTFVEQKAQLGTAHAVAQAEGALRTFNGALLVLSGDSPLLTIETAKRLVATYRRCGTAALLTTFMPDPSGYGRIIRDEKGKVEGIVEEKDATSAEKKISEVNVGTYCFDPKALFKAIKKIRNRNAQKEYYLTDTIKIFREAGASIGVCRTEEWQETLGANSRKEVVFAHNYMRDRLVEHWLREGVTVLDPTSTYIGPGVKIGTDTVIKPNTFIEGRTKIGSGCVIGPFVEIKESALGDNVQIKSAHVREAVIGDRASVGPYASLRPGTVLEAGSKVGTFSETKNTVVGENSKVPHLSYMGDAVLGKNVNVGAGSITCNYDGVTKSKTVIKDGAFIGSDTMFVAPVVIGKGAVTGAGSVITSDVPDESLALERSDVKVVKGWAKAKFGTKSPKKAGTAKATKKPAKPAAAQATVKTKAKIKAKA